MSRFDRVILASVLGLGLVIAILSLAAARFGPSIDSMHTAQLFDGAAINTQIAFTFTERMNQRSVERNLSISPHVKGDFNWSGNTLIFSPRRPLSYATRYLATIAVDARDQTGRRLFHAFHGSFTTQHPHLLYLGNGAGEERRLVIASTSGMRRIIGHDDGSVSSFSVSSDRSLAVYVRRGAPHERPDEIWTLSVVDGSKQRIFRNPGWTIAASRLSPDGRVVAFLATNVVLCRKYYGCFRNRTSPLVELLDLGSRKVVPFRSGSDVPITNFIDFSPAGQLAYTDLGSALTVADVTGMHVTHVPNQGNSLEFSGFDDAGDKAAFVGQTRDSTGGDILVYNRGHYLDISRHVYDSATPAFSTSGKSIAYAAYRGERGIEPVYGISTYSFSTKGTRLLTSERRWSDWAPRWSPDDKYVAFIRSRPQEAMYMGAGAIWVMRSNGGSARPLGGRGENIRWVT